MNIEQDSERSELDIVLQNYNLIEKLPQCLVAQLRKYQQAFQEDSAQTDDSLDSFAKEAEAFKKQSFKFVQILSKIKDNMFILIEKIDLLPSHQMSNAESNFDLFVADVTDRQIKEKIKTIITQNAANIQ